MQRLVKLIFVLALLALIGAIVLPIGFKPEPSMSKHELEAAEKNFVLMTKRIKEGIGFNTFTMQLPEAGYIATKMIAPPAPKQAQDAEKKPEPIDEKKPVEKPEDPGKLACTTNKDELTIIYSKRYYKLLQCRIELTGKFQQQKLEATEDQTKYKNKTAPTTELVYTMTGARIGHVPMPKLLFPHVLELFKTMVFNRKIERIISLIEDVKVAPKSVKVTFKKQIK